MLVIKTKEDIENFLKQCGFIHLASGNNCHEYIKPIPNEDKYVFQVNGLELSQIEKLTDKLVFSENGKCPASTPLPRYIKEYENFNDFIKNEGSRIDFSLGLKNWILN